MPVRLVSVLIISGWLICEPLIIGADRLTSPADAANQQHVRQEALAGAKELAKSIVANGPLAVRVSKQVIKQSRGWPMDERYKRQTQLIAPVFVSEDSEIRTSANRSSIVSSRTLSLT